MANRLLLCLVLVCVLTDYSICGRFSSRGRSSGGSRSKSSWSWGGKSSSASKPSSSSSKHSYPTSGSSSLSGSGSNSHKYPYSSGSSSLSGSGLGSHNYPFSFSGLSGLSGSSSGGKPAFSGSGSANRYPPSPGLSGIGSGSSRYPPSPGLSGSGTGSNIYPPSSGLSGSGSGSNIYPSSPGLSGSGSGRNNYPPSHGLSGVRVSGSQANPTNVATHHRPISSSSDYSGSFIQKSKHRYPSANMNPPHSSVYTNTHGGIGSGYGYNSHNYYNSYASSPQHIYITEYRNSGSRYSDILTGLALYNLGRSHNQFNHHYYNDDYYTRRYYSTGSSHPSNERTIDEAYCTLRIKENNKLEVLKIPCEIVSTFTEGSKKLSPGTETKTVCVSNHTVINNTQLPTVTTTSTTKPLNYVSTTLLPNNITTIPALPANISTHEKDLGIIPLNATNVPVQVEISNPSTIVAPTPITESTPASNISTISTNSTTTLTILNDTLSTTSPSPPTSQKDIMSSSTVKPLNAVNNTTLPNPVTSNITMINSTKCITTTDPLTVKGPPLNPTNMECEVEIVTKTNLLRTKVDCNILTQYSKMPEPPKKESPILPSRSKLKSWLANPPWWMSIFIAL
ncbi:mucin-19-like isoform X3 [Vanessa atalanta]|uniref:mucin-19-like isoform X2 n=1 Tax=Vanessa atalanta TaxID=42275 RepID=UPI001FCD5575|nr:mucin-19-like isoform X2 [Vanessa atalanta]XP_047528159.1 mucin-19-like isoform X3 [Vanessa atalanta]